VKQFRLDDMTKGWFVGDFTPTALHTRDAEVAVKHYAAGDREGWHYHKVATEVTLVLTGEVRMAGGTFRTGDIIVLDPGEGTDFVAVTDSTTVVVKLPSVAGDKYTE
jgi:quercetin dioxygenase-like cupin family protein